MGARAQETPVARTVERWCTSGRRPTADAAETVAEQIRSFPAARLRERVAAAAKGK
jgi:hypothetical protein